MWREHCWKISYCYCCSLCLSVRFDFYIILYSYISAVNSRTNQLRWKVRAGSKFHASGGQLVDVISHQTHKKYDAWDMDFDIAVMKLAQEISIDNITTKIIPLAVQDQFIPDNSSVIASGWGSTYVSIEYVYYLCNEQFELNNKNRDYFDFNENIYLISSYKNS